MEMAEASAVEEPLFTCSQTDIDECKRAFETGGVEGCREFMQKKLNEWKTIPLSIAVIGNSGVGKSSFINTIRGLTADDDGAAAVDVVECTSKIISYPHPNNEMLKFWDLPGVGTDNFPKDKYLEAVDVNRYDFFLLVSATRFTENDTWLGKEIVKLGKKFYYVRTKVDDDVRGDRKSHPKTHNESDLLSKIRRSTVEHLSVDGETERTKVFLIDNYEQNKFDFHKLEESLVDDFPELKRSALILSMCATSEEMIKLKAKALRKLIWVAAGVSAGVALVPVPGVSLAFDTAVAVASAFFYYRQFGLNDESIEKHAKLTSTDPQMLKNIVRESFGPEFFTVQGIKVILQGAIGATAIAAMVIEEFSHFIPIFGSLIAAPLSFGGTFCIHKLIIDKMESVALKVVKYAAEHSVDVDVDVATGGAS